MPHRSKEIMAAVKRGIIEAGGEVVSSGQTRGNHQQVTLRVGEETRKVFLPLTPGKTRSISNAEAFARRMVRDLKKPTVSEFLHL